MLLANVAVALLSLPSKFLSLTQHLYFIQSHTYGDITGTEEMRQTKQ